MVGRMAMNDPWEIARMDQIFFPDMDNQETLTPEQIMLDYGDWSQK